MRSKVACLRRLRRNDVRVMTGAAFFQDIAVLTVAAGVIAAIFSRFGWPKVIGYILAGVILNGYTWGGDMFMHPESIHTIGQLGVVFLMLGMGLSFSPRKMRRVRSTVIPAAVLDTLVMTWAGYMIGARVFGWSPAASFFLGVAICDSATTLLAKVLDEKGWSDTPSARYMMSTSLCEDVICVGAISLATGFAVGDGLSAGAFFASLGGLGVFFLTVLVLGFVFVPRLLRSVAKRSDDEALLLTVLGCCLFVSHFADKFNFSLALGAFLVGVLGASSDVRDNIEKLVSPLKSTFSAVFFVSIGLMVDPAAVMRCLPEILIVSAVVIVGKFINNAVAGVLTGLDVKTSVQNGLGLAQTGEFALMVAILSMSYGDGSDGRLLPVAVGVALLTTFLNPVLIGVSPGVGQFVESHLPQKLSGMLDTYGAWLEKIKASQSHPAFGDLRRALVHLGIYGVLMLASATVAAMLPRFDFTRFSEVFEQYDKLVFFLLANIFAVSLLPMVLAAAREMGDALSCLIVGDGSQRWQAAARPLVRFVSRVTAFTLFFAELTMINVAVAPHDGNALWIAVAVIVAVGIFGWRFFVRMGRRASLRLSESLTAEERREGLAKTMALAMPSLHSITLSADSPAIGGTVVTLNIRAKTGVSVVSVSRGGSVCRHVGPEWEFQIGDTLGVIGDQAQIAALKDLLGVIS